MKSLFWNPLLRWILKSIDFIKISVQLKYIQLFQISIKISGKIVCLQKKKKKMSLPGS